MNRTYHFNPQEKDEQIAVIQFCSILGIPVFHIANGGSRNYLEAINLKRQGVKAGVPDLMIPMAMKGYNGLFIEMKRVKGGRVSDEQREWITLLNANGYLAVVCKGSGEAIDTIRNYISGESFERRNI